MDIKATRMFMKECEEHAIKFVTGMQEIAEKYNGKLSVVEVIKWQHKLIKILYEASKFALPPGIKGE